MRNYYLLFFCGFVKLMAESGGTVAPCGGIGEKFIVFLLLRQTTVDDEQTMETRQFTSENSLRFSSRTRHLVEKRFAMSYSFCCCAFTHITYDNVYRWSLLHPSTECHIRCNIRRRTQQSNRRKKWNENISNPNFVMFPCIFIRVFSLSLSRVGSVGVVVRLKPNKVNDKTKQINKH